MIPFIRREKILEMLAVNEIGYIEDLVANIGVSDSTIRRDLKTLSDEGIVVLLTGGAAKIRNRAGEKPIEVRFEINKKEKEMIGAYAASLIEDGDFIFIGPGSTENAIIRHLCNKKVKLVTNGASHIPLLIECEIDSIILGGRLINSISVIAGPSAVDHIEKMHFDKCFIGGSGISVTGVMTTSEESVAMINRKAIKNSTSAYFLADSSKVGRTSRFEFAKLKKHQTLITTKHQTVFHDNVNYVEVGTE